MSVQILQGDCRTTLATLPERSVHMAVTSPPYWALRSYLPKDSPLKSLELGSEPTPDLFIAALLDVFRAVRRVLRDDATLWVNLGETYSTGAGKVGDHPGGSEQGEKWKERGMMTSLNRLPIDGLAAGNRVGIPERFTLAMQADGWVFRDQIIWHKPSPMPSSVNGWRWERCRVKVKAQWESGKHPSQNAGFQSALTSNPPATEWALCPGCPKCAKRNGWVLRRGSWRTTTAHEVILMFAKTGSYFCDAEAVKQSASDATISRNQYSRVLDDPDEQFAVKHDHEFTGSTANPRSVWLIGPQPLKHKHYAAYPEELPRRCIEAGTSSKGCCPHCGSPWARMVERIPSGQKQKTGSNWDTGQGDHGSYHRQGRETKPADQDVMQANTIGWLPTCDCPEHEPVPCTVLDPFGGSGTTAIAAQMMGRHAISCELNPEYVAMHGTRFDETAPLLLGGSQ